MSGIFDGQETADFLEVTVDQCSVSHEVGTFHAWVSVVIKTGDGEKRDNALHCDYLHTLGDPSDPRHIVDFLLAESHLEASEVLNGNNICFDGRGVKVS